jgi:hypothetical protein
MSIQIDPCKACDIKLAGTEYTINEAAQCCYGVASAFNGVISSSHMAGTPEGALCAKYVEDKAAMRGKNKCNFKMPNPPLFQQSQHFLPGLLESGMNMKDAVKTCMCKCNRTAYPEKCKDNCTLESLAVVESQPFKEPPSNVKSSKKSSEGFYIGFYIGAIIISILMAFLITNLLRKK